MQNFEHGILVILKELISNKYHDDEDVIDAIFVYAKRNGDDPEDYVFSDDFKAFIREAAVKRKEIDRNKPKQAMNELII